MVLLSVKNVEWEKMKLVRDKIPDIIIADDKTCSYIVASSDELSGHVYNKMKEELNEFVENPCYEEAADMLEVLKMLCHINDLEFDTVVDTAISKQKARGGFHRGIILLKVNE